MGLFRGKVLAKRKSNDKDAQASLKNLRGVEESLSEYEALLQRCGEGVMVIGQEGQIERLNQTCASLLHVTINAALGHVLGEAPFAEELGASEQAELLNETLEEEKETNEKLSKLAEQINAEANEGEGEEAEPEVEAHKDKKKARRVA